MSNKPIRFVCFDMGSTLLDYHPPGETWEGMERLGADGLYTTLSECGYMLPSRDEVIRSWWQVMSDSWKSIGQAPKEQLRLSYQMKQLFERWQIDPTEEHFSAAEQACAVAIQKIVRPLEGALEAVCWIKERGLKVGLISNTLWQGIYHQQDLERFGFWPYFDMTLFSSDTLAWKPEAEIFQQAERALGGTPDEMVYVGDSLFFDIYGASSAGWRTVWIEQPQFWMPDGIDFPQADATVKTLHELPVILESWL
jgi:HAD superfamily hydrolase (TIGR01509 family)